MINVIASNNIYGLWGSFILKNLTDAEYKFKFIDTLTPDDVQLEDHDTGLILMGLAVPKNKAETIEAKLSNLDLTELPFTDGLHFANYGEGLESLSSYVSEEINSVTGLVNVITNGDNTFQWAGEAHQEFANKISEGIQSFHRYDGGLVGKDLMLLSEFYGTGLIDQGFITYDELVEGQEATLAQLRKQMKDYVSRKVEQANIQLLSDGTRVVSLSAERYANEIGKVFIDSLTFGGFQVIVLVGHSTRGDDLYQIRTSEGISAQEVAYTLNNGKGKERAATVFLPETRSPIYNTIHTTLNASLNQINN